MTADSGVPSSVVLAVDPSRSTPDLAQAPSPAATEQGATPPAPRKKLRIKGWGCGECARLGMSCPAHGMIHEAAGYLHDVAQGRHVDRGTLLNAADALLELSRKTPPPSLPETPTPRPVQSNCQQEPGYPKHDTVCASIRYPMMTSHRANERCSFEGPHLTSECGEFGEPFTAGDVYLLRAEAESWECDKTEIGRALLDLASRIDARLPGVANV